MSGFGTPEASAYPGVTLRTLYRFIDEGELPAYRMGRVIRIRSEDLEEFRSRGPRPSSLEHLFPEDPGDSSGDREPRRPKPPRPADSQTLDDPSD